MPPLPAPSRRSRSQSISGFPPPIRRTSTDMTGLSRPVSFSAKFQRVHPATTGVTVLEHMERLDAVEAGLKRLGIEEDAVDEEEVDVGTVRPKAKKRKEPEPAEPSAAPLLMSPSGQNERLAVVHEHDHDIGSANDDTDSVAEEDLVAMSKSMSHMDRSPQSRWNSPSGQSNLDWMDIDGATSPRRRTVIAEVRCLEMSLPCAYSTDHDIRSVSKLLIPNLSFLVGDGFSWTVLLMYS